MAWKAVVVPVKGRPVAQVGDTSTMYAVAEVHANDVRLVAPGQSAVFSSPALPYLQASMSLLDAVGVGTLYIEPASPWENGYIESFNGKLRNELLNQEIMPSAPIEEFPILTCWRS